MLHRVFKVGKPKKNYLELCQPYQKRLSRLGSFECHFIKSSHCYFDSKKQKGKSRTVILTEHGALRTSQELASAFRIWAENPGITCLDFFVAGAEGIDLSLVKQEGCETWSLSPAVFTSDMAWLLVWEQIYRSFTINHGYPYHH